MKILVTGGREFRNRLLLEEVLNKIHKADTIKMLIHGGARGADLMAANWAKGLGIHTALCEANWTVFQYMAGPLRNEAMLILNPNLVLAFPGGKGTANMVRLSKKAGIDVVEITDDQV